MIGCASGRLAAQGAVEPVYVPLKITVKGVVDNGHTPSLASLTASMGGVDATGTFTVSTAVNFPVQILPIEMGCESELTISGNLASATKFTLTPPPGFTLLIDGLERKSKNVNGTGVFKIRVLPALDSTLAPAGTATEFGPGQVKWGVALGAQRNGASMGWIWMIGAGVTDWDGFKSVNNLYFEQDSDELVLQKITVDGVSVKRQIRTNEVFVDIITPTTPAASNVESLTAPNAAFELRFYHPSQMTTSGSLRTPLTNMQPFVVYRLTDNSSGSTKSFLMEKQTCSLDASATRQVIRTEQTTLTRNGADDTSYVWTSKGWTLAGAQTVAQSVATWSPITGGHREVMEVQDLAGGSTQVVAKMTTDHIAPVSGLPRMVASVVADPDSAASAGSSIAYYGDMLNGAPELAKRYRFGFPQLSTSTGGAWNAVTYVDPATRTPTIPEDDKDKWLGVIDTSFSPWLDTAAPTLAANSTPTMGTGMLATKYDYEKDVFDYPSRVILVESYRDSLDSANRISKRTTAYTGTSQNGRTSVQADSKDFYGSGANDYLASYRLYYREDDVSSFWRSQVNTEVAPTGAKMSYIRQRGAITLNDPSVPVGFNVDASGKSSRIGVITGAETASADTEATPMTTYGNHGIKPTYLLPGRSTLSFTYRDDYARVVRTESYLRSSSATWELIAWENLAYNNRHQLTLRTASNGDTHELFYTGEYLTREVDAQGVETTYDYDSAGRMWKSTRSAFAGRPALVSESIFDGADNVVEQRSYAADNPNLKAITTRTYDLAGRVLTEKSSGSPQINTDYNPAARTVTVTNSVTTATKVSESFIDGHAKSVTGSGAIEERYSYAFESDGRRRTEGTSGPTGSLRTVKSWTDWMGRNLRTERPAPPGITGPLADETFYSTTTGLPVRGTASGSTASTLSTYDVVGQPVLTGVDADLSGTLEPASAKDRITGKRTSTVFSENAWWATSESYTYMTGGSSAETLVGKSWTRLTGLTGGLVGETRSWDAEGNLTRRTVERDRTTRTVTTRTWMPGITNPQVDIAIDGLAVSSTAPDGLVATVLYDSLRRPTVSRTPRSGAAGGTKDITTTYRTDGLGAEATGLVWTVTDTDGRTSTSIYDDAFRLKTTINPDQKSVTQVYNIRGQITHVYGEATKPVRYIYDPVYGQRTEQHTFRLPSDTTVYTSETQFPADTAAETDRVVWSYDAATGMLLNKTDPLNRSVSYTYDAVGRLATRKWARLLADGTTPLTATTSYDAATGDLLSIVYNDGVTPTVSTTYDRLGRPVTVTDATGTRTFVRDTQKPWRTNSEVLPAYYGSDRALSWVYDEQSGTSGSTGYVMGRSRGFRLGTAAQPAALLEQTMAWSDIGRLQSVSSTRDTTSTQNFAYTYTPNSRLVESLTAAGTNYSLTRTWDPVRNLLTQIETKSGANSYARFAYTHTILGQRATANQTGQAFATDAGDPAETTTAYNYNARGEVTSALAGVGDVSTAPSALIPGRKFAFAYDLAGNRVKSTHQGDLNGSAAVNYTVGKGNQLTQRDNPVVSVGGVIANTSTVMAVDQTPLTAADRQGKHWQHDVTSPETGTPVPVPDDAGTTPTPQEYPRTARTLVTLASIIGGGTGGADLTSFDRRMLTMSPRDEQLRYDRDGNLLRDGTWDYTWDAENHLVRMETHYWLSDQDRKKLEFTYDYQGRRVAKRVQLWPVGASGYGAATETRFLYDGWNLISEFVWSASTSTYAISKSYTWGLDLVGSLTASGGVGGLLQISDHTDNQRYLPGYDGNGNVAVLVRASDGYRAAAYEYGPYGEVLRSEGTYAAKNTFRFSTKFTDTESGLVYYGMRYYDTRNGRFINRDPIEERGGLNLYSFCGNDSVNNYDYLGQFSLNDVKKLVKNVRRLIGRIDPLMRPFMRLDQAADDYVAKNPQVATYIAIAVAVILQQYWVLGLQGWAAFGASVATGMISGAIAAAPYGGTAMLQGALFGGLSAGVAYGIGSGAQLLGKSAAQGGAGWNSGAVMGARVGAHGLAGGGMSVLRGGKFGSGFVSSAASTALAIPGSPGDSGWAVAMKTAWSGAVAGGVSRATGGKFGDAAMQGAFQYLFNDRLHDQLIDSKYKEILTRFKDFSRANSSGSGVAFDLSDPREFQVVLEYEMAKIDSVGYDKYSVWDMTLGGNKLMGVDSDLFHSVGSASYDFMLPGGFVRDGGRINYILQGMAWAAQGASRTDALVLIPASIVAHNALWRTQPYDQGRVNDAVGFACFGYDYYQAKH